MNTPAALPSAPRRKAPLIFKLISLGFVLVMGLVVAEIGVRIVVPKLSVGPMQTRPDAYYGNWLRPDFDGVVSSSTGHKYHQRTNSLGHRAPEYVDAPGGHVICLGDSYTMGETVDFGKEYAGVLRDALRPRGVEVVNFGRAGNGQGRWLKFLERDAKDFHPRVVVMQLCYNDWGDNEFEQLYDVNADGALVELPVQGPRPIDRIRDAIEAIPGVPYLHSYQFIKQKLRASSGVQGFHPDQKELTPEQKAHQDALFMALFRRSMERARASGASVIWTAVGVPDDRVQSVRALAGELGAFELPVPFSDERPDLYHADDPHWNEAGQKFVADGVLRLIEEHGLLAAPETDAEPQ